MEEKKNALIYNSETMGANEFSQIILKTMSIGSYLKKKKGFKINLNIWNVGVIQLTL